MCKIKLPRMAWLSGPKRMQYQGIWSQLNEEAGRGDVSSSSQVQSGFTSIKDTEVKEFGENSGIRSGISLLPGFKEANWSHSNTRVRTGVRMLESSSALPIHDDGGGGDIPRPPTSYTARATRARKAAQMEYKAQLDLQVAERKRQKDLERNQDRFGMTTVSTGPICGTNPAQFQPVPPVPPTDVTPAHKNGVSSWVMASSPPVSTLPQSNVVLTPSPVSSGCPGKEDVQATSSSTFPLNASKSLPACHQLPTPNESILSEEIGSGSIDGQSLLNITPEVTPSTPAVISQSSPQLSEHQVRTFVYSDGSPCDRSMTTGHAGAENVIHHLLPQFSSTPIAVSRSQTENVESYSQVNGVQMCSGGDRSYVRDADATFGSGGPAYSQFRDESAGSPLASTFTQSPQPGTSPCGSYIGDSCSMTGSGSFYESSKGSYKPHVSQTADQRPDSSVLRINYKTELEFQIQERKRQEEERHRVEREEEEKLQKKIKQDQERMRKEYEEEQLKMKQKEEEKRQRQEENLQRLKEAEVETQRVLQERRDRRSKASSLSTESPMPQVVEVKPPPPASPPIPTVKLNNTQERDLPSEIDDRPIKVAISESSPLATTGAGLKPIEHRDERTRPGSGITETLQFLEQVRDILNQEIAASQVRFQKEMEELEHFCSD